MLYIFTEEINEYMNESIYHLTYSTINKSEINIILYVYKSCFGEYKNKFINVFIIIIMVI